MKNEILKVNGRTWLVREAVSREAALDAITMASATGSVGWSDVRDDRFVGGVETTIADVHELNDDGSERKPS